MLFSVNIHGTLKYIFAIFRENFRKKRAIFSDTLHSNLYCVLRSLVAVKLLWFLDLLAF